MPKMTLIEMTQAILNDMDSDTVDSIGDTVEATQVAQIVKDTYYNIISNLDIPEHYGLLQVTALGDSAKPNYMKLADNVSNIKWFKYNVETLTETDSDYQRVSYMSPEDFLTLVLPRRESDTNVILVQDASGVSLPIINDKRPEYFTSFDDEYLVFDSYDSSVDNTLQQSKSMCWGKKEPTWSAVDSFTPDLDAEFFSYFLSECKAAAFVNLKQVANNKEESRARRQLTRWQNDRHRTTQESKTANQPNYGRK